MEMEELVYMAINMARQLKRRVVSRLSYPQANFFSTKTPWKKEEPYKAPLKEVTKGKEAIYRDKGKGKADTSRNREVKCFKCLGRDRYATNCSNNRAMIIKDGEWYTVSQGKTKEEEP